MNYKKLNYYSIKVHFDAKIASKIYSQNFFDLFELIIITCCFALDCHFFSDGLYLLVSLAS